MWLPQTQRRESDAAARVGECARGAVIFLAALLAAALAFAPRADGFVYWTNFTSGTIGRANLNGTGANQSFITGANANDLDGVAVDATHVYWANFNTGLSIGRANLNGTGANNSFISGVSDPCGVAVDGSHVYWANQLPAAGTIGRANLNGTGADQSFITGADSPCGVAADAAHLYWANTDGDTIGRANLNGTGPNQSFITGASVPTGVAVDALAPPPPLPAPPDTTAPNITLKGKKSQKGAKLVKVKVTSDEAATAEGKGNVRVPVAKREKSSATAAKR